MKFNIKVTDPKTQKSDCAVVAIFKKRKLATTAGAINKATAGTLTNVLETGDLDGDNGQTQFIHAPTQVKYKRVLMTGCGAAKDFDAKALRKSVVSIYKALNTTNARDATIFLDDFRCNGLSIYWHVRNIVETLLSQAYTYSETKSTKPPTIRPDRITLAVADADQVSEAKRGLQHATAIGNGISLTRHVSDLPGNVCTPTFLAEQAKALCKTHKSLKCTVLSEKQMEKLGMGSLLSVSRGSREPAKLIVIEYNGGNKGDAPVALVGKGLTFDAGGISIKPSAAMDEMKYDMCGGASVLGTVSACADMGLPINLVGIIPSSENLPDGDANKPGDIVTSMAGLTIEILNTDAEGRLILCDALTYTQKFKPAAVIDIATLTGACVVALGAHASGLLSNNDELAQEILDAGTDASDRAWHMPLWEEYQSQLDSNFADIANIGGRGAGTITAACFLSRFTKKMKWAHLDIAGTAWKGGAEKGATGRPVSLLSQFLINRCEE